MSSSILTACDSNDVSLLRLVLAGNYVNPAESTNFTLDDMNEGLIRSVVHGYKECVELLLDAGADVNCTDSDGETLLTLAVRHNYVHLMEYLLTKPIMINKKTRDCYTALHIAALSDNRVIAEMLLEAGADKSEKTFNLYTPLSIAVSRNYIDLAKFLIKEGCDVNDIDIDGNSLIHIAAKNDYYDMCRLLVEETGAVVTYKHSFFGFTPLCHAAMNGNVKIMEILLNAGAEINEVGKGGETVLHRACVGKSLDCVKFILKNQHFVGINAVDAHGLTALAKAIHVQNMHVVKYLIQEGASTKCRNVNYPGRGFRTFSPHIIAACLAENRLETASILVMSGQYTFQELKDQLRFFKESHIPVNDNIYRWIIDTLKPWPLKNICRAVVNESIMRHIAMSGEDSREQRFSTVERRHNINSLHIPAAIKNYLLFLDL